MAYPNEFILQGKNMKKLFVCLGLILSANASARGLSVEEKMQDFRQLQALVHAEYGPLEFKTSKRIIDLNRMDSDFSQRIQNTRTNQEFYMAVMEYVGLFQDGHFGVANAGDRRASIPLGLDFVSDKVFITTINRQELPLDKFDFEIGDEVLAVDGVPVADVLDSLSKTIPSGNPKSVRRKAAWAITVRSAARFYLPSQKQITLTLRRGTTDLVEDVALDWKYTGTLEDENDGQSSVMFFDTPEKKSPYFWESKDEDIDTYRNPSIDRSYACNPETRIHIPKNATILFMKPFVAYTYPTAKGEVGYIRFPHYSPTDASGKRSERATSDWLERVRFALKTMEPKTVGLVIDQDHNCGGSVRLVENMVSLFIDKPVQPMMFRMRANKSTYLDLKADLASDWLVSDTLTYTYYKRLFDLVENTWRNTNEFMTPFTPITAVDAIYPDSEVRYTKPVVMLIDEMAGSGGDAFPSIMKGIGRAKLFGQQTAGLGGSVREFPSLFNSRMTVRMTVTLFFKPDLTPVENNGAVPDHYYSVTRDDLVHGYRPYQKAFTEYLLQQIE